MLPVEINHEQCKMERRKKENMNIYIYVYNLFSSLQNNTSLINAGQS
jgi:hypothetical protein